MKRMKDEEVVYEAGPSGALLGYWVLTRCLPSGLLAAGVAVMLTLSLTRGRPAAAVSAGVVAGLAAFVGGTAYAARLRRTYRYYVTDRRCAFSGGIFLRVRHSVPYRQITDIEQRQNILERLFGIWRLGIYTPGTSSAGEYWARPEVVFPGLEDPEPAADSIAEMLREEGSAGR